MKPCELVTNKIDTIVPRTTNYAGKEKENVVMLISCQYLAVTVVDDSVSAVNTTSYFLCQQFGSLAFITSLSVFQCLSLLSVSNHNSELSPAVQSKIWRLECQQQPGVPLKIIPLSIILSSIVAYFLENICSIYSTLTDLLK